MDKISILDQIISNQNEEELARLDAVDIVNKLFTELSEREKDVVVRRYGLHGKNKETLENIGSAHSLTRERIRQIETSSVKKLQKLENLDDHVSALKKVIMRLLEDHGGLMEKEYLLDLLVNLSADENKESEQDKQVSKNYLNFLIMKLLHNQFEEVNNSKHFKSSYKLKHETLDHLDELANSLVQKVRELKKIHKTGELIRMIYELEEYETHKDKINTNESIDIAKHINTDLFEEDSKTINENKALYSILRAAKKIEQNKFGDWGVHNCREIKPKTINDKIYLILKNNNKPMHFGEIAERINEIGFDSKVANAATVHNELILDSKYVLVGRGLYGLKEWGFKKGTVTDVIVSILRENGGPATRDEIIEKVLEKRLVKKATIILALMNKDKFLHSGGKYQLV